MPQQTGKAGKELHVREILSRYAIASLISVVAVSTLLFRLYAPLKSIDFWSEYRLVKTGTTFTMDYSTVPDYFSRSKLEWSSSDDAVASVSKKGEISAVRIGFATITVRGKNGMSDSTTIEVCDDNC
jgi:hypothetical protein